MISSVHIKGFRCLRDVRLDLGPLTVIVGPNASGKTALADALTVNGFGPRETWRQEKANPSWFFLADGRPYGPYVDPQGFPLKRAKYVLRPEALRSHQEANEAYRLTHSGANLANLFDTLTRADQEAFVADFVRLVPVYADLKARASTGKKRLQFEDRWKPGLWYEPHEVSDGTMLAAAFVALTYQRDPEELVVIEDPDHGLHPYLQREVAGLLRKLSKGEVGPKPIQIVCTTHSKAFLDYLEPQEVRFIARDRETGETRIKGAPTDNPKWRELYAEFNESLGDLWMTGSLGGVPGI